MALRLARRERKVPPPARPVQLARALCDGFGKLPVVHGSTPPPIVDPELLLLAYRSGIFPMADHRDDPEIFWVEPRLRAILPPVEFHLSRSLRKVVRQDRFLVTCNEAFSDVMEACAAPRASEDGESWISHRIAASYENLHRLGHAHSIECWLVDDDGERVLAGGLYGVGFDRVFCGESMFSRARDSSKVALAWLVAALREANVTLLDCQFITPHLMSLGAVEIAQKRYLDLLKDAQMPLSMLAEEDYPSSLPVGFASLVDGALADPSSSPGKFIAQFLTQTS